MKKLYSLLLLGGLLFFGVSGVWAGLPSTIYVKNVKPSGWGEYWKASGNDIKINVTKSDETQQEVTSYSKVAGTWDGESVYSFVLPANAVSFKLIRYGSDWSNSTNSITLVSGKDYLINYSKDGDGTWDAKEYALHTHWYLNIQNDARSGYNAGVEFMKKTSGSNLAYVEVSLGTADVDYEFYLGNGMGGDGRHTNMSETMTSLACTDWETYSGYGSAKIKTTTTGTYTFSIDVTTHKVSIIYPSYSTSLANLGGGYYATLCLPVEVSIPSGVTAYYESSYNYNYTSNVLTVGFTALDTYIPAGVPVILKGEGVGPYEFEHTSTSATAPNDKKGDFKGVYSKTGVTSLGLATNHSAYVLQDYVVNQGAVDEAHHFGFHMLKEGGWVNASRCYLDVVVNTALKAPAVELNIEGETAFPLINADENVAEKAVKIIEDGKVIIIRNGVKYDATGRVIR